MKIKEKNPHIGHNKNAANRLKKRQRAKNDLAAWMLMLPMVLLLYLMVWRPTATGAIWSFYKLKGYTPTEFIGLRNYYEVIKDTQFLPTVFNTVEYVIWSLIVGFVPPVIIAILINEMIHFKSGFKITIYLPAVIPGVAAMLMWYYLYYPDSTGLLNMILAKFGVQPYGWLSDERFTILYIIIYSSWHGLGASMLLYLTTVQSISTEIYEAATIDGAGMLRRLWHITIPQMSGMLLLSFIKQIIGVFQIMQEPMVMTGGGPNNASISIGFQLYKYGFVSGRAGHALALGVIIFILLMLFTCFYFYLNKKVEDNY